MRACILYLLLLAWIVALPVPARSAESASASAAIEGPRLVITLRRQQLRLDGHVASALHAQQLLQAAGELFAGRSIVTQLVVLDGAPRQWADTTGTLLAALSATISVRATLADRSLLIRGVGSERWPARFRSLQDSLPPQIGLDVDVLLPAPAFSRAEACHRAIAAQQHGPVNFEQSGITLRSSAYPVLDRLLAFANACRKTKIVITGHSDASGDETANRSLSRARAAAVANYFARQGIPRHRLVVDGAGSATPVADNATRYGRSLNRRVVVEFRPGSDERP